MTENQDEYLIEISSLMKRGRTQEIQDFFGRKQSLPDNETFVSYMDGLIDKSHMSRAKIISHVGLSKDYMYKVLRGAKKTTERDYIIAVCLSMKANLLETQRALELYPFPTLDPHDKRSAVIMSAINDQVDYLELDEWLQKSGCLGLRVSPDMPSAPAVPTPASPTLPNISIPNFGPVRSIVSMPNVVKSEADEGQEPSMRRRFVEMEKTNTFKVVEHFGNAPFDFFYLAEYELTSENGEKVYVEANFWPDGSAVYGVSKETVEENDDVGPDFLIESYETLEDATESAYFPYFLDLDRLTDQMVAETMASVNDTKTYGFRMSGKFSNHGLLMFAEAFNSQHPELSEYLQVRQTETGYIYSMTHKSCYMQMELNDGAEGFYEVYFGKYEQPLFLFEVTSLDELGMYENYRSSFEAMVAYMTNAVEQMRQPH